MAKLFCLSKPEIYVLSSISLSPLYQTELAKDSKNNKNKRSVEKLAEIIGVSRKTFYNYVKWYADNKTG